ncbi:hypothetical protein PUN28_000826 [Cardiocondyla obscurior]|uniref:Uncharacterized protein n=1 Tax=Cardiocondyla obscurior TaxID=286306 RepID=A0AAW2H1A6_9HYME
MKEYNVYILIKYVFYCKSVNNLFPTKTSFHLLQHVLITVSLYPEARTCELTAASEFGNHHCHPPFEFFPT